MDIQFFTGGFARAIEINWNHQESSWLLCTVLNQTSWNSKIKIENWESESIWKDKVLKIWLFSNLLQFIYSLSFRVPIFKIILLAVRGPFFFYLDLIVDSIVLYHVIVALGGFTVIFENIKSFPSTVSFVSILFVLLLQYFLNYLTSK